MGKMTNLDLILFLTCNHAGVEVEGHFAAVLKYDGLDQVAVALEADLMSLAPQARIQEA